MLSARQASHLNRYRVARLATVDANGQPHAVPVCFALVEGLLYTPLDRKPKRVAVQQLRRVRDLAANPSLCLLVDDYDEDWQRLRWMQIRGTGVVVAPGSEQQRAIAALREKYPQYRAMALDDLPVIRITPAHVREWAWSGQTAYASDPPPSL